MPDNPPLTVPEHDSGGGDHGAGCTNDVQIDVRDDVRRTVAWEDMRTQGVVIQRAQQSLPICITICVSTIDSCARRTTQRMDGREVA